MNYSVTTFYKFMALEPHYIADLKRDFEALASANQLLGLLLLAPEGVNATVAGSATAITVFKQYVQDIFGELAFKDSACDAAPFKRFKVSVRPEIVQLDRTDIVPGQQSHVSPDAWDQLIDDEETVVIDVRNWYESKLGSFKGAVHPDTKSFSEFPTWVRAAKIPTTKQIGIYCTGGIRCEKAAVALEELGYSNVHQLDGGILNYIEQRPKQNFEGECFVFDHRMSVDQALRPSTLYGRCPHCGNGGDITQVCAKCASEYKTCDLCVNTISEPACSKRCRNELQRKK